MVISTLEFILGFTTGCSIIICTVVLYKSLEGIFNGKQR